MTTRTLGIDLGAETIKAVELIHSSGEVKVGRRRTVDHHKQPARAVRALLEELDWASVDAAAATGRGSRMLTIERVPTKAALGRGVAQTFPKLGPATLVSIGSHGFSVLELRSGDHQMYRENSRCSQGTGNFLRQLVERFDLSIEEASALCEDVENPAALSGRCPVILKTDMTHLANKGEDRSSILAGLYDAVCENVQVLIKPRVSPPNVLLIGGVMRSKRVRNNFDKFFTANGMKYVETEEDDRLYLEAMGAAMTAFESKAEMPSLDAVFSEDHHADHEKVPSLRDSLEQVKRMPVQPIVVVTTSRKVVLGFDIGSTGSKALAVEVGTEQQIWEGYINTLGDPVDAARKLAGMFLAETEGLHTVHAIGATGSGREIVGSLMSSCFGPTPVFVLNEIAAHATGALYFDGDVDTIFEIGGQDAKYIRLDGGRICDAAMNEACSAGTGSFIAEQGGKFEDVDDVVQMGKLALDASHGVSLGQHCSVFMAEVIDEAVSAGVSTPPIVAGIYDSIIQNYLNRVKGNRSVGNRIFCQGMPFMSDALAAAVARQTGRIVVIPPNPGTIGALGIALLAGREIDASEMPPLDLRPFLGAVVESKDTMVCKSTKGCGAPGNFCKIDRLRTRVAGKKQRFLWGGNCSLFDKGTSRKKLPDLSPDPFQARNQLISELIKKVSEPTGKPLVAMTDEFSLKNLMPFFATFVRELGFDLKIYTNAGQSSLKRGIEDASVPFCAPMQMYHGVMAEIIDDAPEYALMPRLRETPRQKSEKSGVTCPIVQGAPDIIRKAVGPNSETTLITSRIDIGPGNLESERFIETTRAMARAFGAEDRFDIAFYSARRVQEKFQERCLEIGRETLAFSKEHKVPAVVVLGRSYTIYNDVLNSNVPNLLRSQGALAIPVDCYPVDDDVPVFNDVFWGYSQANLRAAHQIRRQDDVYSVFCSNYSCGPDSFNLHFYAYIMENKPFAIIETDGHSGDAGTKTRVEAFLYCVEGDRRLAAETRNALELTEFKAIEQDKITVPEAKVRQDLILIPRLGPGAEMTAASFRSEGIRAETLPIPTRESLRIGRRYTSGKECVPMTITTGSLLERIDRETETEEHFAFLMPRASGPCRFGAYNVLHNILLSKTGWKDRVKVISPADKNYFEGVAADFQIRACVGFVASDLLLASLHDVRPVETEKGAANEIYQRYFEELKAHMEGISGGSLLAALAELSGGVFGVRELLSRAVAEFKAIKDFEKEIPTVSVVGEIYVRLDPFANDFVVEKLEARGLRAHMAPFHEWLEYMTFLKTQRRTEGNGVATDNAMNSFITTSLQDTLISRLYEVVEDALDWEPRTTVPEVVSAAQPFVSSELYGEAVLTVGGPIHEYEHGAIDAVISVGPHECMPNKVSEAQFAHIGEEKGLLSMTLALNGDPSDPELLDRFAFEVKERFAKSPSRKRRRREVSTPLQQKAVLAALKLMTPLAAGQRRAEALKASAARNPLTRLRRRGKPPTAAQ
ncbi:MAG: CoA activase [Myxococcales bacterium]|nr:CoA activase [Myxococcales bacterium]